ncbi:Phosphatidylcholine:diacylglycerol cholinephosphotransferase 2 [Cardamine amara subsp. amara]|uniref:Phosphatidylcholine:diacylglycerol cholinephosphotransferase 2 n=1 Tax=Cardamine amara subsp. amara TaxID=228776 RepID=A0ABD0Z427_CARAN
MLDITTKTVVPLRRKSSPLNGIHANAVTIDDHNRQTRSINSQMENIAKKTDEGGGRWRSKASVMTWKARVVYVARRHWIPYLFAAGVIFFTVECMFQMTPASSQPFDLGFVATRSMHRILASSPNLNTFLAALNTVLVGMQTTYIGWT